MQGKGGLRPAAIAALGYALLTALFTWPLPYFFFTHHVGQSGGDARIYLWNLWWVRKALVDLHTSPLQTDYIFYPVGIGLALHTLALLHGVVFVPLSALLGDVAGANLIVCATFVASALATYALCRRLGAGPQGAFLGGLAFGFCPYRLARLAGHYDLLSTEWIPLYALVLLAVMSAGSMRAGVILLAGAAAAACGYTNLSYLIFLALFSLLYGIWLVATRAQRPRAVALRGALVGLTAAALLIPLATSAWHDLASWRYLPYPGSGRYVADLAAYVRPGPAQTVLGPRFGRAFDPDLTDTTVFPGYFLLAAGLAAALDRRTRSGRGFWVLLGGVAFLLSLGPSLRVGGRDIGVPLPFILFERLPLLEHLRAPSRFSILFVLALAVLLAAGWTAWLGRVRRSSLRGLLTAAAAALMVAESLAVPVPVFQAGAPEIFGHVMREPGDFTVLEIPGIDQVPGRIMYDQTVHGKRIFIGTAARVPVEKTSYYFGLPLVRPLVDLRKGRLELDAGLLAREREAAPRVARFLAIRYVVVEHAFAERGVVAFLEQVLPVTRVDDDGERVLLRVAPEALPALPWRIEAGSPESRMYFESGWETPAEVEGRTARSPSGPRSTLLLRRPAAEAQRLVLEIAGGGELSWPLSAGAAERIERLEISWEAAPRTAPPPALPPRVTALRFEPVR
jgi:general stress protein CsbA